MHPMPVILLLDSCDHTRTVLARALCRNGLDTLAARSDIECLDLAIRHQPDLVIIAMEGFGYDGFNVYRALNHTMEARNAPKLAITAIDCGELHAELMAAGFHGIIVKPTSTDAVVRTAWELLGWLHVALDT